MTLLLRCFSVGFLAWHLGLLFPGIAEPAFLSLVAAAALVGGSLVRPLRFWLALAVGLAVAGASHLALVEIPTWLSGPGPSPLDQIPLWSGRQLVFAILPFTLGWIEGWAFTGRENRRGWERLVHGGAVAALFWSQGPYHVTLYSHPLLLALAFGLFLVSELILLLGRPPRIRSWIAAFLVLVSGVAVLWSLLGRYEDQSTAAGGGLMKPELFQFDFAPLIRLEDEISLGDNLVLLYREEGTPQRRYLRRLVLDAYDPAQGFSLSDRTPPAVGRRVQNLVPEGTMERTPIRQEYYLVNMDPSSLLALNSPVQVTPYVQWNRSSFVNAYRVDSLVSTDAVWVYNEQTSDGLTPEQRAFYTKGGDDPEILTLARQMTVGAQTPFEKANAILQNLRDHYYYSLKPGNPGSRGALKHFLFEGKKGYCSYFAFSMTLLLRSLGVPARIAVGFATNPDETVLGFNPVRAFEAHAWVEVPFGPYGWISFDPTSRTPAPGENFQFPKGYDAKDLSRMIAEILDAKPKPLDDASSAAQAIRNRFSWDQLWSAGAGVLPWILVLGALAANEGWRWHWAVRRLRAGPGRRLLVRWSEFVFRARRAGKGPFPGETPEAWSVRTGDPELAELATAVSRTRYAETPAPDLAAERRAAQLGHAFDARRPRIHRLAATVFPWWPR